MSLPHPDDGHYADPSFGGPERVLKYLARYTHRVAISNHRLVKMEEGRVTFRYKDYADPSVKHRAKTMTLSAEEFLRRFVEHVLPKGFMKIRHYGLLGQGHRKERLALCRSLLGTATMTLLATIASAPADAETTPIAPAAPICCPRCGGTRLARSDLFPPPEPSAGPPRTPPIAGSPTSVADTS
jgi:Putative transposase